jgi:hypothetical protein
MARILRCRRHRKGFTIFRVRLLEAQHVGGEINELLLKSQTDERRGCGPFKEASSRLGWSVERPRFRVRLHGTIQRQGSQSIGFLSWRLVGFSYEEIRPLREEFPQGNAVSILIQ